MADDITSINVAENPIKNPPNKNINVGYDFTTENFIHKSFALSQVPSNDNTADLLTEGLNSVANHGHTQRLGVFRIRESIAAYMPSPLLRKYYCSHIVNLIVISIYYDAIVYLMSLCFYSVPSVSRVVVMFIALHDTYCHKPVSILAICFTFLVWISHTVLFHITCVYSLPK